ncbi:MAG: VOC family protein, partial [Rhizobacter sp.]|nr:VOC family protein [Rhizobacter sp.]
MSTGGQRPFHVLGLQQIALGATSKAELRALWVDRLGVASTGWFRSERENVDEDVCEVGLGLARV